MNTTAPHYLLFTEAKHVSEPTSVGRWRFVLEQIGTATRIEEADVEPGVRGERLQLLAVVRGLEALEQRSRVTLITSSKYVGRGIRRGLTKWRQNDWQWEHFGIMTPIKHDDLWKRIDGAMQIHQINCRVWQFDPPQVRTQVNSELDPSDCVAIESGVKNTAVESVESTTLQTRHRLDDPRVSPETDPGRAVEATIRTGNHLKLHLNHHRQDPGTSVKRGNRVTEFLADRVKPIGQGRAFGYAVS